MQYAVSTTVIVMCDSKCVIYPNSNSCCDAGCAWYVLREVYGRVGFVIDTLLYWKEQ